MRVSQDNNIGLEGACDCSMACSTCHVIFEQKVFDQLELSSCEEEDLLDISGGTELTSRLGCQVPVSKLLEGAKIIVPAHQRNVGE